MSFWNFRNFQLNGSLFGNLTISGFAGTFPRKFLYHLSPFRKFRNFWSNRKRPKVRYILSLVQTSYFITEPHSPAAILQQRHAALAYNVLLWYWTSMFWSIDTHQTRYPLTGITWPYRGLKFRAHRGHVFFFKLTADQVLVSIGSRAHVRVTCCKQGWVVSEAS